MMKTIVIVIIFSCLTIQLYSQNLLDIDVTGRVIDANTNEPIRNADVMVHCWYEHFYDEASYIKKVLKTDEQGRYSAYFKEGYEINVAAKYAGYNPTRKYNKLSSNKINVDIKLEKAKPNPTLISLLNIDVLNIDITENNPFIRLRIYKDKVSKDFDFSNIQTIGFDFKTLKTTKDTLSADFWFKNEKKADFPSVLLTRKQGGFIPIKAGEIKSSSMFEKCLAPDSGYVTSLVLGDSISGFFVLCRDGKTYGKIILDGSELILTGTDENGNRYEEYGIEFSYFYQSNGSRDFHYSKEDIDLDGFLVDYRLR